MSNFKTYETADAFYEEADWSEFAINDGQFQWWLAWVTEDGEWYAVRPMGEDDRPVEDDAYRPVGPVSLDTLPLPWRAVGLDSLLAAVDEANGATS